MEVFRRGYAEEKCWRVKDEHQEEIEHKKGFYTGEKGKEINIKK